VISWYVEGGVRFVTALAAGGIEIASMRNRIPFLRRVMDEVTRQAPAAGLELYAGIDADEGPFPASGVTPLQPLHLFVDVETVRTLLADALEALRWSEQRLCTTPERTAAWERAVEQRRRFLAWLGTQQGLKVFLAMYPEYLLSGETDADDTPDEQLT
jgi:hypothetical protein